MGPVEKTLKTTSGTGFTHIHLCTYIIPAFPDSMQRIGHVVAGNPEGSGLPVSLRNILPDFLKNLPAYAVGIVHKTFHFYE